MASKFSNLTMSELIDKAYELRMKYRHSNYTDDTTASELIDITRDLVTASLFTLLRSQNFYGIALSLLTKVYTFSEIDAAMAVGFNNMTFKLYINPMVLFSQGVIDRLSDEQGKIVFIKDVSKEEAVKENKYNYVNNKPVEKITFKEIIAILEHECMHVTFNHIGRFSKIQEESIKNKNYGYLELVNIACDHAINQYISNIPVNAVDLNFMKQLAPDYIVEISKEKKSAEYYLKYLMEQANKNKKESEQSQSQSQSNDGDQESEQSQSNDGDQSDSNQPTKVPSYKDGMGGVDNKGNRVYDNFGQSSLDSNRMQSIIDSIGDILDGKAPGGHDKWKDSDKLSQEIMNKSLSNLIRETIKSHRGTVPGEITEVLGELDGEGKLQWSRLVLRGKGRIRIPFKKTRKRMNRRQPDRMELSGKMMDNMLKLYIIIDTSASMSNEEISYCMIEMESILKTFKCSITVIEIDTKIQRIYDAKDFREVKLEVKGRGGTCFSPVFEYFDENKVSNQEAMAIFFSDGGGESRLSDDYNFNNVVWVITGQNATENTLSLYPNQPGEVALLEDDTLFNEKFRNND